MKQYEIWWAELPQPAGRRPVLLLSRDSAYNYLTSVLVVEITTTVRNIPVEVAIGKAEGLKKASAINCDNLRTLAKARLKERIGALAHPRTLDLKRALGYAVAWEELMDL